MPDPTVAQAVNDIRDVLKKYDLPGIVFVSSKNHTHFLNHVEASWTCYITEDGGGPKVLADEEDYPDRETWKETMCLSIGVLASFVTACRKNAAGLEELLMALGRDFHITHVDRAEPEDGFSR